VYGKTMTFPEARVARFFERFNVPAAREAAHATFAGMLDTRSVEASVTRIAAPTLIVWGRDDKCAPVEGGRRLQRDLPRAKLELLDCAHSPAEERPADFARIATSFLSARGEKAA
jgi:pimeloyl-ACP methyl ester carboxylesterase